MSLAGKDRIDEGGDLDGNDSLSDFELQRLLALVNCGAQVFFNDIPHRISVESISDSIISCFISPIPPNEETFGISFIYDSRRSKFADFHPVEPDVSYVKAFLNGYITE